MTERPILFQGAMVRALLAGTKTQTRRVVKHIIEGPHPPTAIYDWHDPRTKAWVAAHGGMLPFHTTNAARLCPYGKPGDRLWVRESHWWFVDECDPVTGYFPPKLTADDVEYRADGEVPGRIWRPSIHMHRWACRILLEVTAVRVERLQDISEADALAEGVNVHPDHHGKPRTSVYGPVQAYYDLWESINGPGSWEANPFVWVVEFKRVTP